MTQPSAKGVTLQEGQVATLDIDGTLVYVEAVQLTFIAVVAFPEQPPDRDVSPSFTPGKVGAKKISPFMRPRKVFKREELSPRNAIFLENYEQLRTQHGPTYIDRTPEEAAAYAAATAAPKTKAELKAERKAAKDAQKKVKPTAAKVVPRYLQKCQTCNQQPGHPNHGTKDDQHEFVAPPETEMAPAAPVAKAPKAPRSSKKTDVPEGPFKFIGTAAGITTLAAGNPKYKDGNSGKVIIDFIGECGEDGATLTQVLGELGQHPRWSGVPQDRVQLALKQLLEAGLIAPVTP